MVHTCTHTECEHEDVTVTWVQTDREFVENRLDVRIKNKEEKTYLLISVATSADRNVTKNKAGSMLK
jgi:hypothetical protein